MVLEKYAKPRTDKNTVQVGAKIPEDVAREFQALCDKHGLTVSEAIRFLIIEELEEARKRERMRIDEFLTMSETSTTKEIIRKPLLNEGKPVITERKPRPSSGGRKKTANRWKVGKKLPCPICGKWGSAGNFKRDHIEGHGLNYPDAPSFLEAHAEEADRMVQELLQKQGNASGTTEEV